jgi:hypothetical protein
VEQVLKGILQISAREEDREQTTTRLHPHLIQFVCN